MSQNTDFQQFINDDQGYLDWLTANPLGFVVNSQKAPQAGYLVLHKVSCKHINSPNRGNWTTTGFIKTCSTEAKALEEWADRATGGLLSPCGACKPGGGQIMATPTSSKGERTIPEDISSGCPELDLAWKTYTSMILGRSEILIADTDEDLTWHAFLGHSLDMQGFRAAEFAGIDPLTRKSAGFIPLNRGGIGVPELAALWEIPAIKDHLLTGTKGKPFEATLDVLRSHGGNNGASLAEAFDHFPWRKFHWCVRALLQNSAVLRPHGSSFRSWLQHHCEELGVDQFPPTNFRLSVPAGDGTLSLERALRGRLERTFYMVGPALSAYMICDWQLRLWREGRSAVFATFKLDSFHEEFVKEYGQGLIPADEAGFAGWWLGLFPELPPRIENECIWLAMENGIF
jgi:hypothetical protein